MPKEIITENKPQFIIHTTEKYFTLDIDKISPEKVLSLLKKTKFVDITKVHIESPQIKYS
ncbi:MAG: hypothetical protein IPO45_15055 [Saprospiraceae bacterium]|nr:hypothetical protein [Candidatus Brachybacter algidus]